jgi:hypothetical protein
MKDQVGMENCGIHYEHVEFAVLLRYLNEGVK